MSWLLTNLKGKLDDAVAAVQEQTRRVVNATTNDSTQGNEAERDEKKDEPKGVKAPKPKPRTETETTEDSDDQDDDNTVFPEETTAVEDADHEGDSAPKSADEDDALNRSLATAKLFAGRFLSGVKTAADQAKKALDETVVGDFERERRAFEETVLPKSDKVEAPWSGLPDEHLAKKHILALSLDPQNVLRSAAGRATWSESESTTLAAFLHAEDPNLAKLRFQLVPKRLTEEEFWRNYLYRVHLVRQSILQNRNDGETARSSSQTEQVEKTAAAKQDSSDVSSAADDWEKQIIEDMDDEKDGDDEGGDETKKEGGGEGDEKEGGEEAGKGKWADDVARMLEEDSDDEGDDGEQNLDDDDD